ncbi:hypothetical protein AAFF_G00339950 [Aldrovandia affinis]|uniref:PH domain-containing protein n=1 Tax=Aldrovandia affinis TaxID=143900 RepID=A0AAD7SKB3_9TELE|nr:hypothetical protein AAFF_G00339950 [Aldrovandia affinis]
MSTGEDELVFESFLRKRKKRMKLKWVTYWFRLQNSTLCFFSKKNRSSLQLKGQYYMCMVESVREVQKAESKRYVFEISMKNGKRKLLAADTAELRQTWVSLLWRAMQSPGHEDADSACTCLEGAELRTSGRGSTRSSSGSESGRGGPESGGPTSELWDGSTLARDLHTSDTPPTATQNSPSLGYCLEFSAAASFDSGLWRSSLGLEEEEEGDEEGYYDTLPARTSQCLPLEEEDIYDVPLCNRRATDDELAGYGEMTESIYDVPSSLLRRISEQSIGDHSGGDWLPENGVVPDGDEARFRSGSVEWIKSIGEG